MWLVSSLSLDLPHQCSKDEATTWFEQQQSTATWQLQNLYTKKISLYQTLQCNDVAFPDFCIVQSDCS